MNTSDYKNDLNEEQQAVVEAGDGPVLVIAAAGTGKTRTLTHRVAHLIARGVPSHTILLLTFTNRAANEMMERARLLAGNDVHGLWGGTFHHVANRLLRRHAPQVGYQPEYIILDQDDAQRLVKSCSDELELTGKHFPKPKVLQSLFSLAANKSVPVEELAQNRFASHDIRVEDIMNVFNLYKEHKRNINGMDFDDLLILVLALFKEHPEIRKRYQEQFQYVLVDEYQDTNAIQGEWVDMLAERHRNLLVVGDDFQSIYSWRGANFKNIITFPDRYENTQVYKLETNYRSTPEILSIANKCIEGNPEQFQKTLRAVRDPGVNPKLVSPRNGYEQADFIIRQINRLGQQGYAPGDIAIMYRSHYHALEIEMALNRASLSYVITSGMRFFEQAHIKDICAVVRIAGNPSDELSFHRILGFLPRVGAKTSLRIWIKLKRRFDPWDPDQLNHIRTLLPKPALPMWNQIQAAFEKGTKAEVDANPHFLMQLFLDFFYDDYAVETFENYDRRKDDVDGLIDFASKYKSLQDFLHEMALQTNLDRKADQKKQAHPAETLHLTTIHQAKGLEFPVVFVLWLVDGMFPSSRSMDELEGEAEERRLFYVAITRAKDQLFIGVPQTRRMRDGRLQYCAPSRFINEIPDDLLTFA